MVNRKELIDFANWLQAQAWIEMEKDFSDFVDEYLSAKNKSIKSKSECDYCGGSGAAPFHHSNKCPICNGIGKSQNSLE